MSYLFGEGLGQDGHQVLQGSFGVELTGVLRRASLLRGLTSNKRGEESENKVEQTGTLKSC